MEAPSRTHIHVHIAHTYQWKYIQTILSDAQIRLWQIYPLLTNQNHVFVTKHDLHSNAINLRKLCYCISIELNHVLLLMFSTFASFCNGFQKSIIAFLRLHSGLSSFSLFRFHHFGYSSFSYSNETNQNHTKTVMNFCLVFWNEFRPSDQVMLLHIHTKVIFKIEPVNGR